MYIKYDLYTMPLSLTTPALPLRGGGGYHLKKWGHDHKHTILIMPVHLPLHYPCISIPRRNSIWIKTKTINFTSQRHIHIHLIMPVHLLFEHPHNTHTCTHPPAVRARQWQTSSPAWAPSRMWRSCPGSHGLLWSLWTAPRWCPVDSLSGDGPTGEKERTIFNVQWICRKTVFIFLLNNLLHRCVRHVQMGNPCPPPPPPPNQAPTVEK